MPLFEYRCPRCGEKTEHLVRLSDAAHAPACAACGVPLERQWAPVACHTKSGSAGCSAPRGGFS